MTKEDLVKHNLWPFLMDELDGQKFGNSPKREIVRRIKSKSHCLYIVLKIHHLYQQNGMICYLHSANEGV
jgi:hypothetical protein